jgi:hypothetical protein
MFCCRNYDVFTVDTTPPPTAPPNQWSRPGPAVSRPGLPQLPRPGVVAGQDEQRSLSPSPPGYTAGKVYDPNSTDELQEWDERNN